MCRWDVLQICRRYDVSEATSFLLEKLGEVQEAFDVLLKVCSNNDNNITVNILPCNCQTPKMGILLESAVIG